MSDRFVAWVAEAIGRYNRYVAAVPSDPDLVEYFRIKAIEDPVLTAMEATKLAGRGWRDVFGFDSV